MQALTRDRLHVVGNGIDERHVDAGAGEIRSKSSADRSCTPDEGGHEFSFQLSAISCQLSAISYQLSVISYQLSVISYQSSVISYQSSVISCQLSAVSCQLSAVSCISSARVSSTATCHNASISSSDR